MHSGVVGFENKKNTGVRVPPAAFDSGITIRYVLRWLVHVETIDQEVKGSNPCLDREVHSVGSAPDGEPGEREQKKSFEKLGTLEQKRKVRFQLLGLFRQKVLGVAERRRNT